MHIVPSPSVVPPLFPWVLGETLVGVLDVNEVVVVSVRPTYSDEASQKLEGKLLTGGGCRKLAEYGATFPIGEAFSFVCVSTSPTSMPMLAKLGPPAMSPWLLHQREGFALVHGGELIHFQVVPPLRVAEEMWLPPRKPGSDEPSFTEIVVGLSSVVLSKPRAEAKQVRHVEQGLLNELFNHPRQRSSVWWGAASRRLRATTPTPPGPVESEWDVERVNRQPSASPPWPWPWLLPAGR